MKDLYIKKFWDEENILFILRKKNLSLYGIMKTMWCLFRKATFLD